MMLNLEIWGTRIYIQDDISSDKLVICLDFLYNIRPWNVLSDWYIHISNSGVVKLISNDMSDDVRYFTYDEIKYIIDHNLCFQVDLSCIIHEVFRVSEPFLNLRSLSNLL